MSTSKPEICITFTHTQDQSTVAIIHPRKIEIKSKFGAQSRQCWIELYTENNKILFDIGDRVEVAINQETVFMGYITEKRFDSVDDPLSFTAALDPAREWNRMIHQQYESFTIPELLTDVIEGSGLLLPSVPIQLTHFSKLTFSENSIYFVIDLLAKMAGNWYWDINNEGTLRFRSPNQQPDHYTINLRQNHDDVYSLINIECGPRDSTNYEKSVTIPNVKHTAQSIQTRIFARPVSTPDVYAALERSIQQQMSVPHYGHHVDLIGSGEHIHAGDTVRFVVDHQELFPQERMFRVKQCDITYAHEELMTRLHLTSGFESASSYFFYLRSDRVIPQQFIAGRTGVFQFDVSALDSSSHLDAA